MFACVFTVPPQLNMTEAWTFCSSMKMTFWALYTLCSDTHSQTHTHTHTGTRSLFAARGTGSHCTWACVSFSSGCPTPPLEHRNTHCLSLIGDTLRLREKKKPIEKDRHRRFGSSMDEILCWIIMVRADRKEGYLKYYKTRLYGGFTLDTFAVV